MANGEWNGMDDRRIDGCWADDEVLPMSCGPVMCSTEMQWRSGLQGKSLLKWLNDLGWESGPPQLENGIHLFRWRGSFPPFFLRVRMITGTVVVVYRENPSGARSITHSLARSGRGKHEHLPITLFFSYVFGRLDFYEKTEVWSWAGSRVISMYTLSPVPQPSPLSACHTRKHILNVIMLHWFMIVSRVHSKH